MPRDYNDEITAAEWNEILATTEEDARTGRVAFTTAACPDDESALHALDRYLDSILKRVLSRVDATPSRMAASG